MYHERICGFESLSPPKTRRPASSTCTVPLFLSLSLSGPLFGPLPVIVITRRIHFVRRFSDVPSDSGTYVCVPFVRLAHKSGGALFRMSVVVKSVSNVTHSRMTLVETPDSNGDRWSSSFRVPSKRRTESKPSSERITNKSHATLLTSPLWESLGLWEGRGRWWSEFVRSTYVPVMNSRRWVCVRNSIENGTRSQS